ncbi:MAG: hypothetical protein KJN93_01255, partial [Alphaproteobacteria bacterium]|nr:hypothetical protein [Alphaproteobacteria bacterium]
AFINGGSGSDTLISTADRGSFGGGSAGGDIDTLDLTNYQNVRWSLLNTSLSGSQFNMRAIEDQDTEDLVDASGVTPVEVEAPATIFSGSAENFEVFLLGTGDDYVYDVGQGSYDMYGGAGDDTLIRGIFSGGNTTNRLFGGAGNDYLELVSESGDLYGGDGDDTLRVDTGDNELDIFGGRGDDFFILHNRVNSSSDVLQPIVRGGAGYDVVSFQNSSNDDAFRIHVDLDRFIFNSSAPFGSQADEAFRGLIFEVEALIADTFTPAFFFGTDGGERFIGLNENDTLVGRGGNDELYGGAGNDLLEGGAGDDLIHAGTGIDTIDGDDGIDTLTFANARPESADAGIIADNWGGVRVYLSDGIRQSANTFGPDGEMQGVFGTGSIFEIENVIGTQNDDLIVGNTGANALSGSGGNDTLAGLAGNDILTPGEGNDLASGGAGNDTFLMGTGNSTILGGTGTDRMDFTGSAGTISVNMAAKLWSAQLDTDVPVWANTGFAAPRFFNGVGITPQDVLESDPIYANDGTDQSLVLPTTDDYIVPEGDPLPPRFEIASDTQRLGYSGRITEIEEVIGAGGSDTIRGAAADERFEGRTGADSLVGGVGNDTLIGGGGNDVLQGGTGLGFRRAEDLLFMNEAGTPFGPDYLVATGFAMPSTQLTLEMVVQGENPGPGDVSWPVFTPISYAVQNSTNEFTLITTDTTATNSERFLRLIVNGGVVDTDIPV